MADWEERRLGDLVEVNPREKVTKGAVVPTLDMASVPAWSRKHSPFQMKAAGGGTRFRNCDTLVARITPCLENGKTCQVSNLTADEVGTGSTEFVVLRAIAGKTDPDFIYYVARSDDFRAYAIQRMTGSSGRQRVSAALIADFKFAFPSVSQQRAIAEVLGALDDKIESNQAAIVKLTALARTVLGQGEKQVRVADVATLEKGLSYKGAGLVSGISSGLPMVNLGNFNDTGLLSPGSFKFYNGDHSSRHLIEGGGLVVANTDLTQQRTILGRPGLVPATMGSVLLTHHVFAVRIDDPTTRLSLWAQLSGPRFRARAEGFATGTTVAALPLDALSDFSFAVASPEQAAIGWALIEASWSAESQNSSIGELRDALLPELLSGRIRVPEARELAEGAS